MLSVCIPIYNCFVSDLCIELQNQSDNLKINSEIILIDDASDKKFKHENIKIANGNIRYIQLKDNIGRSKIRNLFLQYAQYNYLLFLDCDSQIKNADFLQNYLIEIKKNIAVICGGRIYENTKTSKYLHLRKLYGTQRECISAAERSKKPYASFLSNNFVIRKDILQKFPFEEKIINYGHEDTLFGFRLKNKHIQIRHINNPVLHDFNENNEVFLTKTEISINNLIFICNTLENKDFVQEVKLLRIYTKFKKYKLQYLLIILAGILLPLLKYILIKQGKPLYLFDLYKLLYLSKIAKS